MCTQNDYKGPTFVPGGILEEEYEIDYDYCDITDDYPIGLTLSPVLPQDDDNNPATGFVFDGSGYYDDEGIWHNNDEDD